MNAEPCRRRRFAGLRVIALGGLLLALPRPGGAAERFVVAKGASAREIAQGLRRQGFVWHPWSFVLWAKVRGQNGIRPGAYALSRRMTGFEIYNVFRRGPPLARVTFPEGWTAKQIAAMLESRGITSETPFLQLVERQRREGFLFPDTYFFEQGIEPQQAIDRMADRFREKEPRDMAERVKALKLSYVQIVTLASLVEKEARAPDERPLIAGVYYNRLRRRMHLEADPTVQYALGGWKPQLSYNDLKVRSPYNTYLHGGLPPGPICNPGAASLDAAAHPAQTDYLFFVADQAGRHVFSKTYREHLAAQRGMRRRK